MVKRNDSVLCLEEIATAQREAVRRITAGIASAEMLAGFSRLAESLRMAAAQMRRLTATLPADWPGPHAFTPDLDLYCSVRGCRLDAEEHS